MANEYATELLIVGAGPVGLTLAAECQRYGVSFRIVDQNPSHSTHSKALAIWSNTIEHLAALGLAETFLQAGNAIKRAIFEDNGKQIAEIEITKDLDTLYPAPFILPQSESEALLITHLTEKGVKIERNTLCLDVRPDADGIDVDLQNPDGTKETVRTAWLAGCDGARSLVRHKIPVEFPGVTEKMGFILADAKATGDLPTDGMLISSGPGGNVIVFPVKKGVWRIFALRETHDDQSDPTLEEVQQHMDGAGLSRIRLFDPEWLSHFAVNERVASRNRVGRVFLLGDASHIHSPAGGQGMNTGMQDAFNLGWKLKFLTNKIGDVEAIAESYFQERHPVAEKVVHETSKLLHFGVRSQPFIRAAKRLILPLISQLDPLKKTAAFHLSELDITYSKSGLIAEDSPGFKHFHDLKPGSLARSVEVLKGSTPVSLWREFLKPNYSLVIFSGPNPNAETVASLIKFGTAYKIPVIAVWQGVSPGEIDGVEVMLDLNASAHTRYGLQETGWYLIRPDQYIAARGIAGETETLSKALAKVA